MLGFIGRGKCRLRGPFRQPHTGIDPRKVVATELCDTRSAGETVPAPPGQHRTPNFAASISSWPLCYRKYYPTTLQPAVSDIRKLPHARSLAALCNTKTWRKLRLPRVSKCSCYTYDPPGQSFATSLSMRAERERILEKTPKRSVIRIHIWLRRYNGLDLAAFGRRH